MDATFFNAYSFVALTESTVASRSSMSILASPGSLVYFLYTCNALI
jgi:hypothetical protein